MDPELLKFLESAVGGGVVIGVYAILKLIFGFLKNHKSQPASVGIREQSSIANAKKDLDISLAMNAIATELTQLNKAHSQQQREIDATLVAVERLSANLLVITRAFVVLARKQKLKR